MGVGSTVAVLLRETATVASGTVLCRLKVTSRINVGLMLEHLNASRSYVCGGVTGRYIVKTLYSGQVAMLVIYVKRFFTFFYFRHVFYVFNVFYFPNVFYLKNVGKVQSGKQISKKHVQYNSNEIAQY